MLFLCNEGSDLTFCVKICFLVPVFFSGPGINTDGSVSDYLRLCHEILQNTH